MAGVVRRATQSCTIQFINIIIARAGPLDLAAKIKFITWVKDSVSTHIRMSIFRGLRIRFTFTTTINNIYYIT